MASQSVLGLIVPRRRRGLTLSGLGLTLLSAFIFGNGASGCFDVGNLGAECTLNSDCIDGLVCAWRFCHTACNSNADCDDKDYPMCVGSESGQPYCDEVRKCENNRHCPTGQICTNNDICAMECSSDADCLVDQMCEVGACIPKPDKPYQEAGITAAGTPCEVNSNCTSKLCLEGICRECGKDFDCPLGTVCESLPGQESQCAPAPCSDCSSALGKLLFGPAPALCLDSQPVFDALVDCACPNDGSTTSCEDTLCAKPPQFLSPECAEYLAASCLGPLQACFKQ